MPTIKIGAILISDTFLKYLGIKYFLKTIKDILAGEEITATYSFYKIKGRDKI